jgi:hypothetical protein
MEPLNTDEKLPAGFRKDQPDMDTAMLGGCTIFIITSAGAYLLSVWPHFLYPTTDKAATLRLCSELGLIPSLLFGIVMARRFRLAGACGFVGGALTTSVFLFLRIQQVFVTAGSSQGPTPNYPASLMYLIPIGWVALSILIAIVATPRERFQGLGAPDKP